MTRVFRSCLSAAAAAAVLLVPAPAAADFAVFGGCSGILAGRTGPHPCVPVAQDAVALESEELDVTETPGGWQVEALYVLHNTGPATELVVGFPLLEPETGDDDWDGDEPGGMKARLRRSYALLSDGRRLRTWVFEPDRAGDAEAERVAELCDFNAVFLARLSLAAGRRVRLRHSFQMGRTNDELGQSQFHYILRTGGLWKGGRIGRIRVRIALRRPISYDCHQMSLEGWRWDATTRTMSWRAKDWRPETDLLARTVSSRSVASRALDGSPFYVDSGPVDEAATRAACAGGADGATLLGYYLRVLEAYRHIPPARHVGDDRTDDYYCREAWEFGPRAVESERLFATKLVRDPHLRLRDLWPSHAFLLRTLDDELAARGLVHPPLPPP